MSRIKSKEIKKAARAIVERHFSKLTFEYYLNKLVVEMKTEIGSKSTLNKVAGYVTRLMNRTKKGPIKNLYIDKHEERRREMESIVPKESYLNEDTVFIDNTTKQMLNKYNLKGNYKIVDEQVEENSFSEEEEFN